MSGSSSETPQFKDSEADSSRDTADATSTHSQDHSQGATSDKSKSFQDSEAQVSERESINTSNESETQIASPHTIPLYASEKDSTEQFSEDNPPPPLNDGDDASISEAVADDVKKKMKIKKKKKGAQKAFGDQDIELSTQIHNEQFEAAKEKHKKGGDYLKSVIYGGMDGIITTFAVVAGAAGGNLGLEVVLIMGFSNLFADGISMGFGDFISSTAERDYTKAEMKREKWEYENYPEGEKREMIDIYKEKGLTEEDAVALVEMLSKYPDNFVDTMMAEELGILPPDAADSPAKHGLVTFLSFLFFGVIPLLVYIIAHAAFGVDSDENVLFGIAIALTALTLFFLGALTSRFTIRSWYTGGAFTLLTGATAAASSYLIGWAIIAILGYSPCI